MLLIHDRKLLSNLDTSKIFKALAFTKWTKVAICVLLAVCFAYADIVASVELMQSGADIELAP